MKFLGFLKLFSLIYYSYYNSAEARTAYKIKFITVPSHEYIKSDFFVGFNVVDLAENKVWILDF